MDDSATSLTTDYSSKFSLIREQIVLDLSTPANFPVGVSTIYTLYVMATSSSNSGAASKFRELEITVEGAPAVELLAKYAEGGGQCRRQVDDGESEVIDGTNRVGLYEC